MFLTRNFSNCACVPHFSLVTLGKSAARRTIARKGATRLVLRRKVLESGCEALRNRVLRLVKYVQGMVTNFCRATG